MLQFSGMGHTLTIRLTDEMLAWLKERSQRTGIPMGQFVRDQLETARSNSGKQRFLRHIGAIRGGDPNASSRKGFSRK
jgi:predicted DNA-binding protein